MIRRPALPASALAPAALLAPPVIQSPALVAVAGAIENTSRGPMDPAWDTLFLFNDVEFDSAHAWTIGDLRALPQTTLRADFPSAARR